METNVFAILGVILFFAFLVESLTEYFVGKVIDNVPVLEKFRWLLTYIPVAIGIAGAVIYGFDLVYIMGQYVGAAIQTHPIGIVLTGFAIGRGSSYIHQLMSRFFPPKEPPKEPVT